MHSCVGLGGRIQVLKKLWALPGPSLCYLPSFHGLPDTDDISYKEPNHPVFGSFNHTRKLTRSTQHVLDQFFRLILMRFFSSVAILSVILLLDSIFAAFYMIWHCTTPTTAACHTPLLLQMQWQITAVSIFILIVTP